MVLDQESRQLQQQVTQIYDTVNIVNCAVSELFPSLATVFSEFDRELEEEVRV